MEARLRRGRGRAATSANLPGAPGRAGGWPCRVAPSGWRRRPSPALSGPAGRGLRPGERCTQRCRAAGTVCPALQPLGNKALTVGDVGGSPTLLPASHLTRPFTDARRPPSRGQQYDSGRWGWAEGFVESGFWNARNQNSSELKDTRISGRAGIGSGN